MKVRKKIREEFEAMQFIYGGSNSTCESIKEFLGDDFSSFEMIRHPTAIAKLYIKSRPFTGAVVAEHTDWVLRDRFGYIKIVSNNEFINTYEPSPQS